MVSTAPTAIDDELRGIIENLAEGLFPIAAWIEDKTANGRYVPPGKDLPWRKKGRSLSPKDLGLVLFLEALLRETSADEVLLAKWNEVRAHPLDSSPHDDPIEWRVQRSLETDPRKIRFAPEKADQAPVDSSGRQISRTTFYQPYWRLLKEAAAVASPRDTAGWIQFAGELAHDASSAWPDRSMRSSLFITQFARDVAYGLLGMRNRSPDPRVPDYRDALLIELGEHRRVGNAYRPSDLEEAVRAFREVVEQVAKDKGGRP